MYSKLGACKCRTHVEQLGTLKKGMECSVYSLTVICVWQVAVIKSNPDQSKHLETATMTIEGFSVDLVNLRSETYADAGSRIPQIDFGTPLQDAERRDFTINSLFYNINSEKVRNPRSLLTNLMLIQIEFLLSQCPFFLLFFSSSHISHPALHIVYNIVASLSWLRLWLNCAPLVVSNLWNVTAMLASLIR